MHSMHIQKHDCRHAHAKTSRSGPIAVPHMWYIETVNEISSLAANFGVFCAVSGRSGPHQVKLCFVGSATRPWIVETAQSCC